MNTPVEKILVDGARATGVSLSTGEMLSTDVVVADADLGYVYRRLLPDDGTAARLEATAFESIHPYDCFARWEGPIDG